MRSYRETDGQRRKREKIFFKEKWREKGIK